MFVLHPNQFWSALGLSHLLAWAFIAFASWRLPRSWQDKPVKGRTGGLFERLGMRQGTARIERRRELLSSEPLRWLIGEQWSARIITWAVAILWALGMIALGYTRQWELLMIVAIYGRVLLFPIKLMFAAQATRFFVDTRRTGAFELLLATPVTSREIIAAQWAMLRRIFLPPGLLILSSTLLVALFLSLVGNDDAGPRLVGMGFAGIFGLFALVGWVLDFFAMGALGMWLALTMRKPHLATGATILFVLILPSLVCGFGFIVDIVLIAIFVNKLREDSRRTVLECSQTASQPAG